MIDAPLQGPAPAAAELEATPRRWLTQVLLGNWSVTCSVALLVALGVLAALGPVIWPQNPVGVNIGNSLLTPSAIHPMGTDNLGRDVFARFLSGARISLAVGIVVTLGGAVFGSAIGLVAGALGGWIDAVLMRIMDAILAFPPLILAMAVTVGMGRGLATASLGIIITSLPYFARLLRSDVIKIRELPFVEAARAIGAHPAWIMWRHILPHTVATLLIQSAAIFSYAILTLAALGFVGLGAQVPTPEWGLMITNGLQYTLTGQWWIGVFPGVGVLAATTAASIVADRLRDVLDPRGRYAQL